MFELVINRPRNLKNDLLAGLTVALALVPEAVAFSFVAGVDPGVGLWAAFFMGLITATLGGRPGMISGATGAMAVVMTAFVVLYGIEYLFAAVVLCGIFQIVFGLLRFGKFVRLLPHPVMLGFVNGLAIVIGMAQFGQFKDNLRVVFDEASGNFLVAGDWISGPALYTTIGLIVLTMAIIHFLPRFTRMVPGALAAIVTVTLLVQFTPLEAVTVNDYIGTQKAVALEKTVKTREFEAAKPAMIHGDISELGVEKAAETFVAPATSTESRTAGRFHLPQIPFNFQSLGIIFGLALTLAAVGLIESLMTLTLIDELTETRGNGNRECMGQGLGNVVSGFFGAMGGCAMIGQSMINIRSGGRGRLSGISAALFLLCFIVFPPLWACIGLIPVAALIGVMFIVSIATFEWTSFRLWNKIPKIDFLIIVLVSSMTVIFDLAVAVGAGVVVSALVFAWKKSHRIHANISEQDGVKVYELDGPMFFGSVTAFKDIFTPNEDPDEVVIEFRNCRVYDHSALEAVHGLCEKYRSLGKRARLKHLSPECQILLMKSGDLVEVDPGNDPSYHIPTSELA